MRAADQWQLAESLRRAELIDRARGGGMLSFTMLTKPDYQANWHHQLLCSYLNRFLRREIRRLMVFMPPRYGKSELTSRRLPALIHGRYPNEEILAGSYSAELASDMTVDVQRIMDTPIYHEIFPFSRITAEGSISKYARKKNEHELIPMAKNDAGIWVPATSDVDPKTVVYPGGSYRSAGVGGPFTGRGGHWLLLDDPIKNRQDADSKAYRTRLNKWYTSSARSRLEGEGSVLLTVTRWHPADIAGYLLDTAKNDPLADQWTVLILPAIKETHENPEDPRQIGEALWPEKFSLRSLSATRAADERDWQSLYQQRPTNPEGSIIKREWFNDKFYKQLPRMDIQIQSWDFAVKDTEGADYTVCLVMGRKGVDKYVIDMYRQRADFPTACTAVRTISAKWPLTYKKLIEDKANGPAVIATLKKIISGMIAVEPNGDKVARVNAVTADIQSGNVYLPDPSIASWVHVFLEEVCDFPHGQHDDIVDAFSQGLYELRTMGQGFAPMTGHSST